LHWYLLSVDKKYISLRFWLHLIGATQLYFGWKIGKKGKFFTGKNLPGKFTALTFLVYCMHKLKYNYMPNNYNQCDHCTLIPLNQT